MTYSPSQTLTRAGTIVGWIGCWFFAAGLVADTPAAPAEPSPETTSRRDHWAFKPVVRPQKPAAADSSWPRNAIDHFIVAGLKAQGLSPAPEADRTNLVRRLSFDLRGLPPTPAELQEFLADESAQAYERLVDRFLAAPQYGERWAQHWLDVVRYAETEGFEYDRHVPDAWRYRDYVIKSFNDDKSFDRFLTEQIAGDEMASQDSERLTAVTFHRLGPVRRNAGNPEIALSRNEVLTERTDIIGAAFLGLTVGCARCHDHKFDPIPQRDYYRLQAFVAATQDRNLVLASREEKEEWEQRTKETTARIAKVKVAEKKAEGELRMQLEAELHQLEGSLPLHLPTIPTIENGERTEIHLLKRGDWERPGEQVGPRGLSVLVPETTPELRPDIDAPRTRLAGWLADPNNPLTARVIVNRIWQYHFGQGIVKTPNDFGFNGDRPSHPELLDWLAAELIGHGWHLKPIHRLILLSGAYRQSSAAANMAAFNNRDPDNRLLWHFNRRRLSGEEIRDGMLAICGKLNPKAGGPSVIPPADRELVNLLYTPSQWQVTSDVSEHYRRSIYLIAKRNLRLPFMEVFDQPALLTSCARRESSSHAPQALELLNGKLANELAAAFARRLEVEAGDAPSRVKLAYQLATGRWPTDQEMKLAVAFLADQPLKEFALAMFNLNDFLYVR